MSIAPTLFTAPATTTTGRTALPHALVPRQTPLAKTVRDPYLGYRGERSNSGDSFLSDLEIRDVSTDGTVTSWIATKTTRIGLNSTMSYTDFVTRLEWQVFQSFANTLNQTKIWTGTNACALYTTTYEIGSSVGLDCQQTLIRTLIEPNTTYTQTTVIAESSKGPSPIVIQGGDKTTPAVINPTITKCTPECSTYIGNRLLTTSAIAAAASCYSIDRGPLCAFVALAHLAAVSLTAAAQC